MARTLFIGDSLTCGYDTVPGQQGPAVFSCMERKQLC